MPRVFLPFFTFGLTLLLSACLGGSGNGGQLTGGCNPFAIVNGEKCGSVRGPIALLELQDQTGNLVSLCTGTFITTRKILTAAHCFMDIAGGTVRSGDFKASIIGVAIHPRFRDNASGLPYDVAVATIDKEINIAPLPLLASWAPSPGMVLTVMGYGVDEEGKVGTLRGISLVIYHSDRHYFYTQFLDAEGGLCLGDSGGPAVTLNYQGIPAVVGINHAVFAPRTGGGLPACGHPNTVSIFVPVLNHLDFILKVAPEAGLV